MTAAGRTLLALLAAVALLAPWLAPNPPDRRFDDQIYAPPTPLHVFDAGAPRLSFRGWRLVNRRARAFEERAAPIAIRWFDGGRLVSAPPDAPAPLLLLGADPYGRDIFSRLLHGARLTLGLALLATLLATLLGALLGAAAGYAGGALDAVLSRATELVLVLPAMYVALALRAALPLVLSASAVFALLLGIFVLLGWPTVARGVRAIVQAERDKEYVAAAAAAGAGPGRLLGRHLLPAAAGYLAAQASLLLPAFILAEATLSFVGFGFPDSTPTWGSMLQEAANVSLIADAPWMLSPAVAIAFVALAVNLVVQGSGRPPVQLEP